MNSTFGISISSGVTGTVRSSNQSVAPPQPEASVTVNLVRVFPLKSSVGNRKCKEVLTHFIHISRMTAEAWRKLGWQGVVEGNGTGNK